MHLTAEQFTDIVNKNKFIIGYTLGAVRARKTAGGYRNLQVISHAVCSQIFITHTADFFWCNDIRTAHDGLNFAPWKLHGAIICNAAKTRELGTDTLQMLISTQFGLGTKNNIVIAPELLGAVLRDARRDSLLT